MIDGIPGTLGVIAFCAVIFIFTGIAFALLFLAGLLTASAAIAMLVGAATALVGVILGIVFKPRRTFDHYGEVIGDHPKVP